MGSGMTVGMRTELARRSDQIGGGAQKRSTNVETTPHSSNSSGFDWGTAAKIGGVVAACVAGALLLKGRIHLTPVNVLAAAGIVGAGVFAAGCGSSDKRPDPTWWNDGATERWDAAHDEVDSMIYSAESQRKHPGVMPELPYPISEKPVVVDSISIPEKYVNSPRNYFDYEDDVQVETDVYGDYHRSVSVDYDWVDKDGQIPKHQTDTDHAVSYAYSTLSGAMGQAENNLDDTMILKRESDGKYYLAADEIIDDAGASEAGLLASPRSVVTKVIDFDSRQVVHTENLEPVAFRHNGAWLAKDPDFPEVWTNAQMVTAPQVQG